MVNLVMVLVVVKGVWGNSEGYERWSSPKNSASASNVIWTNMVGGSGSGLDSAQLFLPGHLSIL